MADIFVVLERKNLGEDRLIYLLGQKSGKVVAVAKYGRKSIKRFLNALEPTNVIRAHIRNTRFSGKTIIERADIVKMWEGIREDFFKILSAWLVLEQVKTIAVGNELFHYLQLFLQKLEESPTKKAFDLAISFSIFILTFEGFRIDELLPEDDPFREYEERRKMIELSKRFLVEGWNPDFDISFSLSETFDNIKTIYTNLGVSLRTLKIIEEVLKNGSLG